MTESRPRQWCVYWEFSRPFTLLMPAVGMIAGGLVALGAEPRFQSQWADARWKIALNIATGALMAAVMNAGSNGLNQIFDLSIDRINKPSRPLPSGRLTLNQAWLFTAWTFAAGFMLAWMVNEQCFSMAIAAALLTACYSVPPMRTKRWGIPAALTIGIPRGFLLMIAGWSTVKTIVLPEPWLLSSALGLFILGATATKDFADIEGDRAGGCKTLPVQFGIRATAIMISPFFVFPFLIWAWLAQVGWLSARSDAIYLVAFLLPLLGAYISFRILRRPEELSRGENHISWKLIYLLAMLAYVGIAAAYLMPRGSD